MRIVCALLLMCLAVLPGWADSRGHFPGKGSYTAWVNANVFFKSGVDWSNKGNMKLAAEELQKAIDTYPYDGMYYYNLGVAQAGAGDVAGAEFNLREATGYEKHYFPAWYNLGSVLLRQQRLAEARTTWRHAAGIKGITPEDKAAVEKVLANLDERLKASGDDGKHKKKKKGHD